MEANMMQFIHQSYETRRKSPKQSEMSRYKEIAITVSTPMRCLCRAITGFYRLWYAFVLALYEVATTHK